MADAEKAVASESQRAGPKEPSIHSSKRCSPLLPLRQAAPVTALAAIPAVAVCLKRARFVDGSRHGANWSGQTARRAAPASLGPSDPPR